MRDAIIWAIPAIIFGLVLRAILTAYQPLAYWGSDSESYFSFAYRLLNEGVASIPAKRRIIYPILLLPVAILPGSPLQWLLVFQHIMGLLTLIPLAYCVRKVFIGWRWWVIPVTVVYAGMPLIIWYEHELLAEAFFYASFIWAAAAWFAWIGRANLGLPSGRMWWLFVAVLALCVWTKPAGRFFWPGIVLGLIYVRAWRFLRWPHWLAITVVAVVSWSLGEGNQASRLLYTSSFPLTNLESPVHADLKAEIAPMVRESRERLDYYYLEDNGPKQFLAGGFRYGDFPAWQELDRSDDSRFDAMRELALEGIKANPHLFLYIALQRTAGSVNWTTFKLRRFNSDYFQDRFEPLYEEMVGKKSGKARMLQVVLGLPRTEEAPSFAEVLEVLETDRPEPYASWMQAYAGAATSAGVFTAEPVEGDHRRTLWELTPTALGWWLLAGVVLSFFVNERLRATVGVWLVIACGYAVGVHLVGSSNPRFFATAWPILFLAMATPLEAAYLAVTGRKSRSTDS